MTLKTSIYNMYPSWQQSYYGMKLGIPSDRSSICLHCDQPYQGYHNCKASKQNYSNQSNNIFTVKCARCDENYTVINGQSTHKCQPQTYVTTVRCARCNETYNVINGQSTHKCRPQTIQCVRCGDCYTSYNGQSSHVCRTYNSYPSFTTSMPPSNYNSTFIPPPPSHYNMYTRW